MDSKKVPLEGKIIRGLGEGAYFMSMHHYQKEIKNKLGFIAYPGTLNLKVSRKQINSLRNLSPICIDGFKHGAKSYGGVCCYKARLKEIEGSVIMPKLTKHKDIVEFIAPVHLKSELGLRDGDKVKVELVIGKNK